MSIIAVILVFEMYQIVIIKYKLSQKVLVYPHTMQWASKTHM